MNDDRLSETERRALAELTRPPELHRHRLRMRIRDTLRARGASGGSRRAPNLRWAAAALGAVALFLGGVEYGRRLPRETTALSPGEAPPAGSVNAVDPVSFAIQARGTAYVAELARLSETAGTLDEQELEQAREVATAIMYGAAMELVRAAPEDDVAGLIVRLLGARRSGTHDPLISF